MPPKNFLSCDWGTSHFRLRLVETELLKVLAEVKTPEGAAHISLAGPPGGRATRFEKVLLKHTRLLFEKAGTEAVACVVSGMATSNIGWHELPYAPVPLKVSASCLVTRTLSVSGLTVMLVSGVHTADDVMRGEECELLGLAGLEPGLASGSCCLVLPGTHSKHLQLERNTLTNFTTFMTGEIHAHLRESPTLRAALAGDGGPVLEPEFLAGVSEARKMGLLAALFKIRSRPLVSGGGCFDGSSFLSGALIGAELLRLPKGSASFLAGTEPLRGLYELAASALGVPLRMIPLEKAVLATLRAHREILLFHS
jgi:2-dehydro-3-deoxygalactonokinase